MSIPLDNLYHYLHALTEEDIIIYRAYPHGSKNLEDITPINNPALLQRITLPILVAHDQEPLDYNYLESQNLPKRPVGKLIHNYKDVSTILQSLPNLKKQISTLNVYEKSILCHSEKNSAELDKFNPYFVGVYYWCHALVARDWFRFAEHDPLLNHNIDNYKHDFLVYNRAWSGTREYRLKFSELLIENSLAGCTLTKFSPWDSGTHYTQHTFKNTKFQISNFLIEETLEENTYTSNASADYCSTDYQSCAIEVVLETLFDDQRNHLTEKILRSIACNKPFILVSTPGSLQYLRDYGFKTFDSLIDESYDDIQDPAERLAAVVAEMTRIKNLSNNDKLELFSKLNEISMHNQVLFFSNQFQQMVVSEFVSNFKIAFEEIKKFKNGNVWRMVKNIMEQDSAVQDQIRRLFTGELVTELNWLVDQLDSET